VLIGFWLLAAGADADPVSLELVALLLVGATGAIVLRGWQARRRIATTGLATPVFGDTLIPFASFAPGAVAGPSAMLSPSASLAAATVPGGVRVDEAALRATALVAFVRLQTAWDDGDRAVLAALTTRSMFAELEPVLDARAIGAAQRTDVLTLHAEVIGSEAAGEAAVASVLFSGLIRDRADAGADPFRELWMLERDGGAAGAWKLAGQQTLF
jgi:predicted lipid-binding transport protein (Tim44 family)